MNAKLVKNKKVVKLPRVTGSVESTFQQAVQKAKNQKWKRVVIIGEGEDAGHYFLSRMHGNHSIAMLESAKHCIQRDYLG